MFQRPRKKIRLVAGVDAAFGKDPDRCIAGLVLWDIKTHEVVEQHIAARKPGFPYIPGLLSFREAPAVIAALRKLSDIPDAVMFDGQGVAHPRRFGIACHVGVLLDLCAVGCGKSRLIGAHQEPATQRGSEAELVHKAELVGSVLRTRDKVNPVYVSVGHRMTLPGAVQLVLDCATGYRLPEPTRLADRLVAEAKRGLF